MASLFLKENLSKYQTTSWVILIDNFRFWIRFTGYLSNKTTLLHVQANNGTLILHSKSQNIQQFNQNTTVAIMLKGNALINITQLEIEIQSYK